MQQKKSEKSSESGQQFDPETLKFKRLKKGLNQIAIANRMGISFQYLSDLESGRRDWNADLVSRFEAALKL